MTTGKFIKFPSIEAFSSVNATVKRRFELDNRPKVLYRGKVKLHGTNAGIRVDPDGTVTCFKRTGVCNVENDNAGFANWVETVKDKLIVYPWTYILYGEWAGPGIQKKVAVSQIAKKTFFVFAAHLPHAVMLEALPGEPRIPSGSDRSNYVMLDKSGIDYVFNKHNVFETIPWGTEEFVVDFRLQSSMERFTKEVTSLVEACDKVDPYIKDRYGIEGIGEGYVFVPLDPIDSLDFDVYSDFLFKAKGESHHVSSSEKKVSIQIDPAVLEGSAAFAKEFVTQGRCEQGVTEACGGEAVMKNMGAFMKWIGQDVQKESVNELEASGLDWKNVSKAVNQQARDWYILATERNL